VTDDIASPYEMDTKRQKVIESLFDGLPADFSARLASLQAIRKTFYAELATQFQPALNEFARTQPQLTQDDCSDLATSINQMIRHLGLALVCPRTNVPATLVVDTTHRGDRVTVRYRFHTIKPSGRRSPTYTCYELPNLELCQAPLRIEALSKEFKDKGREKGLGR
jgi:hypothetical protein